MSLVDHLKRGTLEGIQTCCIACKRSARPADMPYQVVRTESMDTYFFYCSHCKNILSMDFDYKDGQSSDVHRCMSEFR